MVDAVGFEPGEPLVTGWCKRSVLSSRGEYDDWANACEYPPETASAVMFGQFGSAPHRADGYGHVRLDGEAPRTVQSLDCASKPGVCLFVIAAAADLQRSALVPITIQS